MLLFSGKKHNHNYKQRLAFLYVSPNKLGL